MPHARAVLHQNSKFPFYEWVNPLSKWEDDEFEDYKHGSIEERVKLRKRNSADILSIKQKGQYEDGFM